MSDADEIAILCVELADIEPLIWRRVAVRTTTNLQTLHRIIQAAMGWLDYHLWEYEADDVRYGVPDPEDAAWGRVAHRASATKLAKFLKDGPAAFGYTYDMGDNWEHRVIVERLQAADPDTLYPVFLGGERRCPPEDCGSVPGYYDFLDAISGPDKGKGSRKKREMLTWYGRPYDPDNLDEERVRAALARSPRPHVSAKPQPSSREGDGPQLRLTMIPRTFTCSPFDPSRARKVLYDCRHRRHRIAMGLSACSASTDFSSCYWDC